MKKGKERTPKEEKRMYGPKRKKQMIKVKIIRNIWVYVKVIVQFKDNLVAQ